MTSKPRRSRWRFSLREILLATTAAAALAALFAKASTRETTDFGRTFNPRDELTKLCTDAGLAAMPTGGGGDLWGDDRVEKNVAYWFPGVDPAALCSVVMPALQGVVRERIEKEPLEITGQSASGYRRKEGSFSRLNGFTLRYRGRRIEGLVRARLMYDEQQRATIVMTLDEW